MKVVSNASPLINLGAINQLDLLRQLYRQITIPKAVWAEVVRLGRGKPGSRAVSVAKWVRVKAVRDRSLVTLLLDDLDIGEAEAIALARELGAHLLLIDELRARRSAKLMGLPFTGLVGVLIEANRKGLVADLGGTLRELRERAGFRLADDVAATCLPNPSSDPRRVLHPRAQRVTAVRPGGATHPVVMRQYRCISCYVVPMRPHGEQGPHQPRQGHPAGPQQQVDMVGGGGPTRTPPPRPPALRSPARPRCVAVLPVPEDHSALDAPQHDMVQDAGRIEARAAGHGAW
jgi:predicted nucleic acid-binding protein